jgi:hypothetical protein
MRSIVLVALWLFGTSAERTITDAGVTVRVRAVAEKKLELDFIGAPHAIGVPLPKMADRYRVHLQVDGRPEISVAGWRKGLEGKSHKEVVKALIASFELKASPDRKHLAFRFTDDPRGAWWTVLHLLPSGPPFPTRSPLIEKPDFAGQPAPEAAALAELEHGNASSLVWAAVAAQPPRAPWDDAILQAWPDALPSRKLAIARAPKASAAWRAEAARKARQTHLRAVGVDLIDALADPAESAAMNDALLEAWPSMNVHPVLLKRLPSASADFKQRAAARARASADERKWLAEAGELLFLVGDPARAAAAVLVDWPQTDSSHRVLVAHLAELPASARTLAAGRAAELYAGNDRTKRARAAHLLAHLERDSASCERLKSLVDTAWLDYLRYGMPERCRK